MKTHFFYLTRMIIFQRNKLLKISFFSLLIILSFHLVKIKQKQNKINHSLKKLKHESNVSVRGMENSRLPERLNNLVFADDIGIVTGVKKILIKGATAYNPTLISTDFGYDLFFRYDVLSSKSKNGSFCTYIGVAHIADQLNEVEQKFKRINLGTDYAEDPRIVKVGRDLFLFYNDLDQNNFNGRFMCLAQLNQETYDVNYVTPLEMNLKCVEKNWSPFEYIDEHQKIHMMVEYSLHPRKVMKVVNPKIGDLSNVILSRRDSFRFLKWPYIWGEIRGGTPAIKIDNEYLAFFHSSFQDVNGVTWFNLGAYTFEANPPFKLTGISSHPILFKGIYDTLFTHTAPHGKRIIYPGGFVVERKDGRDFVQLACGENDCGIKIITIDLEKLKKNMIIFEKNEKMKD